MLKVMHNGEYANLYLKSLPTIYAVVKGLSYGVIGFRASRRTKEGAPLVYKYFNCDGTCDQWRLVPIKRATSAEVVAWTTEQKDAAALAGKLNEWEKMKLNG